MQYRSMIEKLYLINESAHHQFLQYSCMLHHYALLQNRFLGVGVGCQKWSAVSNIVCSIKEISEVTMSVILFTAHVES